MNEHLMLSDMHLLSALSSGSETLCFNVVYTVNPYRGKMETFKTFYECMQAFSSNTGLFI